MSDNNDGTPFKGTDREPESFPVAPEPASPGPAAPCPDRRGSGRIVLLTSSRACRHCGGTGRLEPAGGEAGRTVEAPDGSVRTYDGLGRLIMLTRPGRSEMSVWRPNAGIPGQATADNDGSPESGDGGPIGLEPPPPALCAECSGTGYVTFPGGSRRCTRCRGQ